MELIWWYKRNTEIALRRSHWITRCHLAVRVVFSLFILLHGFWSAAREKISGSKAWPIDPIDQINPPCWCRSKHKSRAFLKPLLPHHSGSEIPRSFFFNPPILPLLATSQVITPPKNYSSTTYPMPTNQIPLIPPTNHNITKTKNRPLTYILVPSLYWFLELKVNLIWPVSHS